MLGRSAPSRKACAKVRAVLGTVDRLILAGTQVRRLALRRLSNPIVRFDVEDCIVERFGQYEGSFLRPNGS
jgi:hypothetical protein